MKIKRLFKIKFKEQTWHFQAENHYFYFAAKDIKSLMKHFKKLGYDDENIKTLELIDEVEIV